MIVLHIKQKKDKVLLKLQVIQLIMYSYIIYSFTFLDNYNLTTNFPRTKTLDKTGNSIISTIKRNVMIANIMIEN